MATDDIKPGLDEQRVSQMLDNLLDIVLALKAGLRPSNMDSNSIGGTSSPLDYLNPSSFLASSLRRPGIRCKGRPESVRTTATSISSGWGASGTQTVIAS